MRSRQGEARAEAQGGAEAQGEARGGVQRCMEPCTATPLTTRYVRRTAHRLEPLLHPLGLLPRQLWQPPLGHHCAHARADAVAPGGHDARRHEDRALQRRRAAVHAADHPVGHLAALRSGRRRDSLPLPQRQLKLVHGGVLLQTREHSGALGRRRLAREGEAQDIAAGGEHETVEDAVGIELRVAGLLVVRVGVPPAPHVQDGRAIAAQQALHRTQAQECRGMGLASVCVGTGLTSSGAAAGRRDHAADGEVVARDSVGAAHRSPFHLMRQLDLATEGANHASAWLSAGLVGSGREHGCFSGELEGE